MSNPRWNRGSLHIVCDDIPDVPPTPEQRERLIRFYTEIVKGRDPEGGTGPA